MMFSSLPSASKIYVSSSKPKQKNLNSAKKKRKKSAANSCTPVRVYEEETLVSSSTLRNCSASQLSLDSHEESIEVELNSENDDHVSNANDENICRLKNIENFTENKSTTINEATNSPSVNSACIQNIESNEIIKCLSSAEATEVKNESDHISDGICCDICIETDIQETVEAQENLDNLDSPRSNGDILNISNPNLIAINCEECEEVTSNTFKSTIPEEVTSTLHLTLLATDDSPVFQSKDSEFEARASGEESNNSIIIPKVEVDNELSNVTGIKDINSEVNEDSKEIDLISVCGNVELYEKNGVLSENSCVDMNERKDSLGENITSDLLDSSSVRSDCCTSTNIFDIHVDNSEHNSLEGNHVSSSEDCRIQSPEQSEVSCTESIMYDNKFACQNDSTLLNCCVLAREVCKKHAFPNATKEDISNSHHLPVNSLDTSYSLTNLQKVKSEYLRRSLSLPEKICSLKNAALNNKESAFNNNLDIDKSALDKSVTVSSKCCYMSDKSTFTIDKSIFTANKSTITSDFVSPSDCKDVATTPMVDSNLSITENKFDSPSLKDNTMLIMKVLPPVSIMQARARSYVFGSIGPTESLLGNEELSRFFPNNKVTVFVGTWNMNGHDPPESIDDFLLPLDVSSVPDIYAIGVQESMQSRSEWEILLQTTLGPSHVLFTSTSFGVLHLSIFMRRDLIWFCSEPEDANIATRPGSMIKTKGAVAICFMFFGTSLLFVNSHLTAHEQKLKERLSDYEKICSALDLPKQIPLKSYQKDKDVTSRFDCVFWSGDLNFRVVQDRPSVLSFLEEKIGKSESSCNLLMKHDQLCQSMAKGVAFHGFKEGMINFIPSYKFDVGTSCFDSSKQRVPSYTDRILYRSRDKSSVVCLHYNAVPEIFTSDHKPVFAVFNVSIKPGRDNIPLAAGLFKREIYVEAIKRRAQQLEISRNHKQSTICNVM